MNRETTDLFTTAVRDVLTETGFSEVRTGTPSPRTAPSTRTVNVSVSVGLAGDIRGIFAVESEMATATGYAAALGEQMGIPLEDPDQFGVMHRAALSELVNQMSGRATIELSGIGLSTDITPPTVMTGDDIVFTVATGLSFVEFEVTSTVGRFVVALGFQD